MTRILTFEGPDRSGKDTLIKAFGILTQFRYVGWNRGVLSNIVYNRIHHRGLNEEEFWNLFYELNSRFNTTIFLTAKTEILQSRHDNKDLNLADYDEHVKIWNEVVEEASTRFPTYTIIRLDSSYSSPEELAEILFKTLHP